MRPGRENLPPEIYQVRIALLDLEPEIWRRLLVPPEMTLRGFSDSIQIAMGWNGSHLHEFRAGKSLYGQPDHDDDPYRITRRQDDRKVPLYQLLPRTGSTAEYTYDFGDDWRHKILYEKLLPADPAVRYPVCVAGEHPCPPDDCGGPPGYFQLRLRTQSKPRAFSLDAVNAALARLAWQKRR